MLVSVIIATYNREKCLCNTLKSVFKQGFDSFEIIVVDQTKCHEPETINFLKANQTRFRLVKLDKPGLPNARNEGIKTAEGEILLFCDDDVILKPNWIQYHVDNYHDSEVGAVGGRIIEVGNALKPNVENKSFINIFGRPKGNFSSINRMAIKTVRGGNMSFSRKVLREVGVFDTNFIGTAILEESDLSYRILRSGYKIVYDPRAELFHLPQNSGNQGIRRANRSQWYRDYFHNGMLFLLKNKPHHELLFFIFSQLLIAFKHGIIIEKDIQKTKFLLGGLLEGYNTYRANKDNNPAI